MFDLYILVLFLGISEVAFFIIGYILGKSEKKIQVIEKMNKTTLPAWNKPFTIVKDKENDNMYVGAVQRPSAKQLAKWKENPKVKEEKEAISESLNQDPELVRMKKLREDYIKSTNTL